MTTILIIDDEETILTICQKYLEKEGYTVITSTSSVEAVALLKTRTFDLMIVDIMIPAMSGYELVEHMQDTYGDRPFLFISALGQEKDRLYGLSYGADDYITKPFSPRELVLRVKNILRRTHSPAPLNDEITFGGLRMNQSTRQVKAGTCTLELTVKEFDLLWLLINQPSKVFTKSELVERVWGYDYDGDANTMNVHIHRLREKLSSVPSGLTIKTVWGLGYKAVEEGTVE